MTSRARVALAALLCAYAAWGSRLWREADDAWERRDSDYASLRTLLAFDRVPILDIERSLDAALPEETPVALAPSLEKNGALVQRLTEGLYPRRIDRTAADVLALGPNGEVVSPRPKGKPLPVRDAYSFALGLPGLLVAAGAVFGFGLLLTSLVPALMRPERPALAWPVAWLAGCAAVGALVHVATWTQIGVPWWAWRFAGWAALTIVALRRRLPAASRPSPEALVPAALVALLLVQMAVLPVTGWDGRSIWLFHAKQIFFHGKLALADLRLGDSEWSHPVYPALVPAVMALFAGASRVFDERDAALAVALIWSGALAALWVLARGAMGRWTGALVTLTAFFALAGLTTDLYMDGIVAVLLAVTILAFADDALVPVGILAAAAVSLVKVEGAAAAVVLAMTVRRPKPILFVPALLPLLHAVWLRMNGVTEFQARIDPSAIPSKLPVVAAGIASVLARGAQGQQHETQLLLRIGLVGLAAGAALAAMRIGSSLRVRVALAGAALVAMAIVLGAAMPQDAPWVVTWTLDRLLLHPALAFAMLPFV
ncbi:MAG TPA: hypothetical protein VFV19_17350 [Candidatus Polarisedimenticolaceae bacterium]|nr:hypothetical protein [Candidatus Polarisedimenticolaceae bacterium]